MPKTPNDIADDIQHTGREVVDTSQERLTTFVTEKPVLAVLISLVTGILLGKLVL